MRYFVTGASGFIGGEVARQLRAQGHEVRALVRSPEKCGALEALGVKLYRGDVTDRASLVPPMTGVDGVFHIAGWYHIGVKDSSAAQSTNVEGTRNVLEAMRELKVARGVYTSTLAVNSDTHGQVADESYRHTGPYLSVYERTKAEAHAVARQMMDEGLPLVIVMPGGVYGKGDTSLVHDLTVQYLRGKLRAVPRVTAMSLARVEDTARGHVLAMEKGISGQTYILAGPGRTLVEVFALAEKLTGVPAPRFHPPTGFVKFLAAVSGSEKLKAATATYIGTCAKAQRELGYQPRPLEEGLPEILAWEKARLTPA